MVAVSHFSVILTENGPTNKHALMIVFVFFVYQFVRVYVCFRDTHKYTYEYTRKRTCTTHAHGHLAVDVCLNGCAIELSVALSQMRIPHRQQRPLDRHCYARV